MFVALVTRLREKHSIVTRIMPVDVMRETLRRFDRHRRQLLICELVDGPGRTFQLAFQLGLAECSGHFRSDRRPRRTAGRYAAPALPDYACELFRRRRHDALPGLPWRGGNLSYDVHVLAQRFNAGFEQVCHRLTTLQRPNARGVPFFMLRVDNAGNVSKRFSSGTFPFSKFGGTCPLWNVHSTFDTPDRLLKQIIELPDGARYFSIAQMVRRPVAPHPQPQPRFAIGLGCEIRHAARLVYASGMDLEKTEGTPIGVNCRLCERENCSQRAEPPITRTLISTRTRGGCRPFASHRRAGIVEGPLFCRQGECPSSPLPLRGGTAGVTPGVRRRRKVDGEGGGTRLSLNRRSQHPHPSQLRRGSALPLDLISCHRFQTPVIPSRVYAVTGHGSSLGFSRPAAARHFP